MLIVDVCDGSVNVADVISVYSNVVRMDNMFVQDTVVDKYHGAEDGNGGNGWKSGAAGVERGMGVLGIDPSRVETIGTVPEKLGRYPVGAATTQTELKEKEATNENRTIAGARSAHDLLGEVVNNACCAEGEVVVDE